MEESIPKKTEIQKQIEELFPCLKLGTFSPETPILLFHHSGLNLVEYQKVNVPGKETEILGRGAFGEVWLVKNKTTRKRFAMKVLNKHKLSKCKQFKNLIQELSIQRRIRHDGIIKLYDSVETKNSIFILTEYASKGNLFCYTRIRKFLSEKEAFKFFVQIGSAINFLHKNSLMHRDIKPENIMITESENAKLCDFGCCASYTNERERYRV